MEPGGAARGVAFGLPQAPVAPRVQVVHRDRSVDRREIGAASDTDRAERNAAAAQQEGIDPGPRLRQARADQADMSAHGQSLQRHRNRARPANLDDAIDTAAIAPLRPNRTSRCS